MKVMGWGWVSVEEEKKRKKRKKKKRKRKEKVEIKKVVCQAWKTEKPVMCWQSAANL